ncbi:plasmid pRiA4b ORF-3 family protein [Amycolatopsis roodepoortensis]|uniref:plasmid pRiA4b ORF-3 family protein n=1 Tax=Amycolatopsis roodepoortensis TaxID=700274 RepID=UPI00214B76D0|nr:plasmid pRiA4b ORF-3 family protein [Amycolatopsis roodepoortensis]UUV28983.1 plasmid pRiA4b ORF-3 family protein [Amycolatopsis roodepoortensis]
MVPAVKPELVEQVCAFTEWVGAGRKLTQTGRLTLADAKELVPLLKTGDVLEQTIGDHVYRTRSSEHLPNLMLVVECAKVARLVRKTGQRLVPVKKNQALLDDPQKLWFALFTGFDQLGQAFLHSGFSESLLRREFADGSRAALASLYGADGAVPIANLCTTVRNVVSAPYILDDLTEFQSEMLRSTNDRDTKETLEVLQRLGAVTLRGDSAELTELGRSGMRRILGEPEAGDPIYQVKITLLEIEGLPVWRRVLVPAAIPLDRLHVVIQAAMGWENYYLHHFVDGETYYGEAEAELQYRDERKVRLDELVKPGGRLVYNYDFGDSWDHEILVEEATVATSDGRYPRCIAGQAACPPEDVGGTGGYARLIQILEDPGHPEHQDVLGWLGLDDPGQFDPAHFDLDGANQRLTLGDLYRPNA